MRACGFRACGAQTCSPLPPTTSSHSLYKTLRSQNPPKSGQSLPQHHPFSANPLKSHAPELATNLRQNREVSKKAPPIPTLLSAQGGQVAVAPGRQARRHPCASWTRRTRRGHGHRQVPNGANHSKGPCSVVSTTINNQAGYSIPDYV